MSHIGFILLCGSLSLLHLCFQFPILKNLWSLSRGQGFEKSVCKLEGPVGELGPSLCPAVTPCSVKCPSSALQAKALWFCDLPLMMPGGDCSVAPSKLYWILKARKHKPMGIVRNDINCHHWMCMFLGFVANNFLTQVEPLVFWVFGFFFS